MIRQQKLGPRTSFWFHYNIQPRCLILLLISNISRRGEIINVVYSILDADLSSSLRYNLINKMEIPRLHCNQA